MLIDHQLSFTQPSRPIQDDEYRQAQERGFQLKAVPIAIDGIAIAVHSDLKLAGMIVAQLREIDLGRITNWKQIGGPDLAIIPYSREPDSGGTMSFFVENISYQFSIF